MSLSAECGHYRSSSRRSSGSLPLGILANSGVFGGAVIPVIFKAALESFGSSWAFRVMTLVALTILFLSFVL